MARKKSVRKSAPKKANAAVKKLRAKIVAFKKMHKSALKKAISKAYKEGIAAGKKKVAAKRKKKSKKRKSAKKS